MAIVYLKVAGDKFRLGDDRSESVRIVVRAFDRPEFPNGKKITEPLALDCFRVLGKCETDSYCQPTFNNLEKANPFAMLKWLWDHMGKRVKVMEE